MIWKNTVGGAITDVPGHVQNLSLLNLSPERAIFTFSNRDESHRHDVEQDRQTKLRWQKSEWWLPWRGGFYLRESSGVIEIFCIFIRVVPTWAYVY